MPEQRRARRLAATMRARCRHVESTGVLGRSFEGTLVDLSSTGIGLVSKEDLGFSPAVYVEFSLGGLDLAVDARIVRRESTDSGYRYGLEIVGLGPTRQAMITKHVFTEIRRRDASSPAA